MSRPRASGVAALALAMACGGDAAPRAETPDSAAAAVPAPPPDPASWTVSANAYGPVRIGMSVAETREVVGQLLVPRDTLASECDYLAIGPDGPEVLFMIVHDQLVRLDVRDSGVVTDAGARIGDSEARIGMLYGADRVISTPHAYTDGRYLTVVPAGAGDQHRVVFETDGRSVTEYRAGLLPMVGWVEGCS